MRLEAIGTVATAVIKGLLPDQDERFGMIAIVCRLATEKLDRVRFKAAQCLRDNWAAFGLHFAKPLYVRYGILEDPISN